MAKYDEAINVAEAMIKYGGSFVSALGEALMCADSVNQQKIHDAFLEYWKQYLELYERNKIGK